MFTVCTNASVSIEVLVLVGVICLKYKIFLSYISFLNLIILYFA